MRAKRETKIKRGRRRSRMTKMKMLNPKRMREKSQRKRRRIGKKKNNKMMT